MPPKRDVRHVNLVLTREDGRILARLARQHGRSAREEALRQLREALRRGGLVGRHDGP